MEPTSLDSFPSQTQTFLVFQSFVIFILYFSFLFHTLSNNTINKINLQEYWNKNAIILIS